MWEIYEHALLCGKLPKIPLEVLKRYEKWKDIVVISGPSGLRLIKGFHDERLRGKWQGYRSSRLGLKYRVIYRIENKKLYVQVIEILLMITGKSRMRNFRKARKTVDVSVGESVRIIRELQGLSQAQLSALTGIPQSTISAIENDRIRLGVERAKVLARALECHPAVLVFPGWNIKDEAAA